MKSTEEILAEAQRLANDPERIRKKRIEERTTCFLGMGKYTTDFTIDVALPEDWDSYIKDGALPIQVLGFFVYTRKVESSDVYILELSRDDPAFNPKSRELVKVAVVATDPHSILDGLKTLTLQVPEVQEARRKRALAEIRLRELILDPRMKKAMASYAKFIRENLK